MKHSLFIALLLLPLSSLPGCGGGSSPAPETPKKVETPPPPVTTPAPPPLTKTDVPPPPKIPDPPKAASTAPVTPVSTESTAAKPPAVSAADPAPVKKSGKPDEFDPEIVGGKPIGTYVKQLDSANKDDVIEALNALKFIPKKAEKYLPKITELTKSKDKEIAQEAADAIKTINGK
jgi:hypothetical protein